MKGDIIVAYYNADTNKIVEFQPRLSKDFPGWLEIDCGCCGGLEWGGELPRECSTCNGSGRYFEHQKTGTLAQYPGGPLLGKVKR